MASSYRYSIAVQRYRYRYIRYVASDVAAYVNHWILLNLVSCTSTITTTNNSMEKSYLLGSRHGTGLQLILVVLATTTSRYPEQLLLVGRYPEQLQYHGRSTRDTFTGLLKVREL
jgi:hypothetical protein